MSSSYNTPCSKHKLVVSIYSNTETSLAMSILAVWCRVVRSRDFSAPRLHPIVIHVITWITNHVPTPEGWKSELVWLIDL